MENDWDLNKSGISNWSGRKSAVIVAHPDDETLWCGGIILIHPEADWHIISLCRGLHPMIGFYQGAGDQARLIRTLRVGSLTIGTFAVLFALGVSTGARAIVQALTHDDAVAAVGGPLLASFVILFPLYAAQLVMATYWQASGIMGRSLVVVLARPTVFLLPALLILPRLLALRGLVLATPAADLLSGLSAAALLWWSARPTVRARL